MRPRASGWHGSSAREVAVARVDQSDVRAPTARLRTRQFMNTRLALLALALVVTGCGSATTTYLPAAGHSPEQSPTAASSLGPGDLPVAQTARYREPFDITYTHAEGTSSWRLTLSDIKCGGSQILDRAILAKRDATVPQPDAGMQFCLVKFNVTNESNKNYVWTASSASVNVGMRAYLGEHITGPLADVESAYNAYADPSSKNSGGGLNPGASGVSWGVFEIPAGATATSVSVPLGTSLQLIGGVDQVLIELEGSPNGSR